MANMQIRLKVKAKGITMWMLADELGISEASLYRMLRKELLPEKRKHVLDAIDRLAKKKK